MRAPEHVRIAIRVGEILDGLGLRHMVCGSVASSLHGEPRSTNDIDFVVEIEEADVAVTAAALSGEFFVEDLILTKLEWFRNGGEVSDRQWRDVQGLLKLQRGRLDETYLTNWASVLGVDDLLQRARRETT